VEHTESKANILTRVPENPDKSARYIFYLHGLIVEEKGIRPKSEEFGYYEYELILQELAGNGFIVLSEARKQGTNILEYSKFLVSQIKALITAGVPPCNITVVGASKGGIIGAYASNILKEKNINYVFLSGLFEGALKDNTLVLHGNVLSIHDASDKIPITPEKYFERSKEINDYKAIILEMNKGHGIIFRPYKEWIVPLVEWARKHTL
jgi:hypothetical protein